MIEFVVQSAQRVSPHLVRVRLGGPGFAQFEDRPETDKYVKLMFVSPEPDSRPVTRTYTVRSVDHDAATIDIDIVIHGSEGLAGPWAARARPGDRLRLLGPGGGYRPTPPPTGTSSRATCPPCPRSPPPSRRCRRMPSAPR